MSGRRTHPGPTPSSETSLERDRESGIAYFAEVPRDDESRPRTRWSEPPPNLGDPRRDVTGALHDVSNALTVMLGWLGEARAAGASREAIDDALRIVEQRARGRGERRPPPARRAGGARGGCSAAPRGGGPFHDRGGAAARGARERGA